MCIEEWNLAGTTVSITTYALCVLSDILFSKSNCFIWEEQGYIRLYTHLQLSGEMLLSFLIPNCSEEETHASATCVMDSPQYHCDALILA